MPSRVQSVAARPGWNARGPTASLELRRPVAATPDRVFEAWTDPAHIPRSFRPGGASLRHVELQPRVGARWRMKIAAPDGRELAGSGVFREIDRPHRIVYIWNWVPDTVGVETVVSVDFLEGDGGTEIVLRHEGFPAPRQCDRHLGGWTSGLEAVALRFPLHR